ncbi:hypothetical protein ACYX7E_09340 [Luteimonas sp. RIT-PG2_3]
MLPTLLLCAALATPAFAQDAPSSGDNARNASAQAFQDHIAYVATFAMLRLIEACAAMDPDYLPRAASAYFRFVNTHQDAIERGRLLTLSVLAADDTLPSYRDRVLASRLGPFESGTAERRQAMCGGALAMLTGERVPTGEWPPAD